MTKTRRNRVHVIPETEDITRPNACAALRLVTRFTHPTIADSFKVSLGSTMPAEAVDLVVLQRLGSIVGSNEAVEDFVWSLKRAGTKLLYDIDDNLLDCHPDPETEKAIAPRRRTVRLLLREADHVTVSTPLLRDRVQRLNSGITVVPNALDERRLAGDEMVARADNAFRIGYFGTLTHLRDLMSILGSLRAAFVALPQRPMLVICGVSQETRFLSTFDGFADTKVIPTTGDYDSFLDSMFSEVRWDIGLAPLVNGTFEMAKSDIKFLEYAAFGVPGIYADHPAYANVQNGITGLIASPNAWAACIAELAASPEMRARIAEASRRYLFSTRTLATSNQGLATVIDKLLKAPS
jgi:glycosyltransferase involved in cell wall biosynthesis